MNGMTIAVLILYFLPSLIAVGKRNFLAIAFLNLIAGWTVIGWIVCFIWACASRSQPTGLGAALDQMSGARQVQREAFAAWPAGPNEVTVHGESMHNLDGTSRQRIIAGLSVGDPVRLVREPNNRYDSNAIRVDADGGTIGYVAAEEAASLRYLADAGMIGSVTVKDICGGEADRPSRGVWLKAMICEPEPSLFQGYEKAIAGVAIVALLLAALFVMQHSGVTEYLHAAISPPAASIAARTPQDETPAATVPTPRPVRHHVRHRRTTPAAPAVPASILPAVPPDGQITAITVTAD
jgi:hypothetical protein